MKTFLFVLLCVFHGQFIFGLYGSYPKNQTEIVTQCLESIVAESKNNREMAWLLFWQQLNHKLPLRKVVSDEVIRNKNQELKALCLQAAITCGDDKLAEQCLKVFIPDDQLQCQMEELAEYPCSKSQNYHRTWCDGATRAINKMKERVAWFKQKSQVH